MIGKTLGHYQIIEEIGSGGMGVVYKARDMHLDRFVALKTLPPQRVEEPERKRRFVQEAKAASALNHPNIVHIYDISSDAAVDYIAMEYVEGQTLGERVAHRGLRLAEVLKYAIQIADALAKAHSAGIIHRDLKPSNIMVNADGTVKVLDFGLAKLTEEMTSDFAGSTAAAVTQEQPLTEKGIIVGTVAYMSPEQAEGRTVDARSDIFSFGSVLYEMVTGQRAFQGATKISTLSAILSKEPAPLSTEIPHDLERTITRCLRKDPARRFQNMADLRVTLEELKEESDSRNQTSLAAGTGAALPSTRILLSSAGLVVLLLACAAGLAWYFFGYRPGFKGGASPAEIGPGGKLTLLVSSEGGLSGPALSPDGKMLAYVGENQGRFDLFVGRVAGGERVQLTDDDAEEGLPSFSPDGERIVYTRFDPETMRPAIWIVPTLGGQAVRVVSDATQAAWSPDGTRLAFISRRPAEGDVLSVAAADGRNVSAVMNGDAAYPFFRSPSWSPDGNSLAVTRSLGGAAGEIWLVSLDGSPPRRLSNDPPGIFSYRPVFTQDGRGLVHVSNRAGATNLWMLSLEDGQLVRLTSGPGPDTMPSVAGDGSIAFSNTRERCALAVHNLVDGNRRDILTHSSYIWAPCFSPSGLELAFSRAEQDGIWHIWIAQLKGGAQRQLTSGDLPAIYPRFTPDGSAVIYHTWSAGPDRIWRVPREGGPPVAITPARQDDDQYGDISPDGQHIVFARTEESITRIYVSDIHGGELRRLTEIPATLPRWSPDGKSIAFGLSRGYLDGIWVMKADGTGVRKLSETGGWPVWWPDGSRLGYQTIGKDGGEEVCVVPAAGGSPETLTSVRFSGTNNAFDISPDGNLLATSNCEVISSDIWLLEPQELRE